jgi:hypothetical protein
MSAMRAYGRMLTSIPRIDDLLEPHPGDSLRAFFRVFVPIEPIALGLYIAASLVVVVAAARIWRSRAAFELRASSILLATILISPHAFAYDLILLAPVFLLLVNWMTARTGSRGWQEAPGLHAFDRVMVWSLCALFIAPLLAAVPVMVRLQCSVTAMLTLLAATHRASRRHTPAPEIRRLAHVPRSHGAAAAMPDGATTMPGSDPVCTDVPPADSPARLRPATR